MIKNNVSDWNAERLKRGLGKSELGEAVGGAGSNGSDDGDPPDMSEFGGRLSKLEGAYDALKVVRPMTLAVLSIMLAVMVVGFAFLGTQVARLDGKIEANAARVNDKLDAIPQRLAEEFRAMRTEMSAQTSAVANAITAAKQAPAQVLLVPAPSVETPAPKP
jgi:hypothetical protein